MTSQSIAAVILAGGQATRMGGGDKVLLPLGGQRIIEHITARLAPQCAPLAISANGDPARFARYGLAVIGDSLAGHPGPLAGVLAAMDWAAAMGVPDVLTVAGDSPFLPLDLAETLKAHAKPIRPCLAATLQPGGTLNPQPTFGLWPVGLRDGLRADLQAGLRKVRQWAELQDATFAAFSDETAFFNINTPDDLILAERMVQRQ